MPQPVSIFGLAGSLRRNSYNRMALRAAGELLPEGASLDAFDLPDLPGFDQDKEKDPPAAVVELKRRIRAADAVLLVTPEYNFSIPGVLKNAIDWASRPYGDNAWEGKPAAILSASVGLVGGVRAQYHLRQVLVTLQMPTVNMPEVAIGGAHKRFDESGRLTDETSRKLIGQLLAALVALTRRQRGEAP
jgi:chromate reductase